MRLFVCGDIKDKLELICAQIYLIQNVQISTTHSATELIFIIFYWLKTEEFTILDESIFTAVN